MRVSLFFAGFWMGVLFIEYLGVSHDPTINFIAFALILMNIATAYLHYRQETR